MRILVTGASGFIGRHLQPRLRRDGHEVIALTRGMVTPTSPSAFVGPADLADITRWASWPDAIDAVVHLAAHNPSEGGRTAANSEILHHVNVEGTRALAKRAASENVKRIIFLSSANVHAAGGSEPVRETDTLAPQSPYALSKQAAEAAFWEVLLDTGTQGCVLRPAPVYGKDGRGNITKLVKLAGLPWPLPIKGLGGPRSLLAVDQLVDAITLCLHSKSAAGKTFLLADSGALRPDEIVATLRRARGRSAMLIPVPVALFERLARLSKKDDLWRTLTQSFVLDTRSASEALGWHPSDTAAKLTEMVKAGDFLSAS